MAKTEFFFGESPAHIQKLSTAFTLPTWSLRNWEFKRTEPKTRFASQDDWIADIMVWFKERDTYLLHVKGYLYGTAHINDPLGTRIGSELEIKPVLAMGTVRTNTFTQIQETLIQECNAMMLTNRPSLTVLTPQGVIL